MSRDETFAETVARLRARPPRPERVPQGRRGDQWGDLSGRAFELVEDDLDPVAALRLAAGGAQVVHDVCGCGGDGCELVWLSSSEVAALVDQREVPVLRILPRSLAGLEHWRTADGSDLVVAVGEVSWG